MYGPLSVDAYVMWSISNKHSRIADLLDGASFKEQLDMKVSIVI